LSAHSLSADYIRGSLAVAVTPEGPSDPTALRVLLESVHANASVSVDYFFGAPSSMNRLALELGMDRIFLVSVDESAEDHALADGLRSLPGIEAVELDRALHLQWVPDDPQFPDQWPLKNTADIDIDAPEAWDVETGDSDVIIAIVDSGIMCTHGDLAGKIWVNEDEVENGEDTDGNGYVDDLLGWDFIDADNDPNDDIGHGTRVSGIAAAETNNGVDVAGVCPDCQLMACRVCADGDCSMFRMADAIYYATENGASVINLSIGLDQGDICYFGPTVDAAFDYAVLSGVVLVAAAGNHYSDAYTFPACDPRIIAVANHRSNGEKSVSSNWGSWVDVAAPGDNVVTTNGGGGCCLTSGTSMSSPHVAGVAGLLLSARPNLTPADVRQIIMDSSEPVDWPDTPIAAGRVNAYSALIATGVSESNPTTPGRIAHGSFPNPFNPVTTIAYEMPRSGHVDLRVYSTSGRVVRVLLDSEFQSEGNHAVSWRGCDDSGRRVASGAYFYRLNVDGETHTAKMIMVK